MEGAKNARPSRSSGNPTSGVYRKTITHLAAKPVKLILSESILARSPDLLQLFHIPPTRARPDRCPVCKYFSGGCDGKPEVYNSRRAVATGRWAARTAGGNPPSTPITKAKIKPLNNNIGVI